MFWPGKLSDTAGDVSELNQFDSRCDCHNFSRKRRQIHNVLNRASAEDQG